MLTGVVKSAIWGGDVLSREWGKIPVGDNVAESWELTVREQENAMIRNGRYAGRPLGEVLRQEGHWNMVSPGWDGGIFPLLIKLLDAGDRLSVQVHPDDEVSWELERDVGKTEMWYIIGAEPGASLVYGLRDGVSREDFCRAMGSRSRLGEILKSQPVRAGEVYFIPAGLVHAIGGGILLAEIQQNADVTYRVYDYDRRDKTGQLRPLHTEKACRAVKALGESEILAARFSRRRGEADAQAETDGDLLADCDYFRVCRRQVATGKAFAGRVTEQSFVSLLTVAGQVCLSVPGGASWTLGRGECVFLPAGMGDYRLTGEGAWLETMLPEDR